MINPQGLNEALTFEFSTLPDVTFLTVQMAIAAVAHIYVYPATPYRRGNHHNLNKIDSVADELEEDIEGAVTSVKDSVKDVVMGGGECVSPLFCSLKVQGTKHKCILVAYLSSNAK